MLCTQFRVHSLSGFGCTGLPAVQQRHLMPRGDGRLRDVPPDELGATDDEDPHAVQRRASAMTSSVTYDRHPCSAAGRRATVDLTAPVPHRSAARAATAPAPSLRRRIQVSSPGVELDEVSVTGDEPDVSA